VGFVLISVLSFIILILVLVGVHELGHFATARFFGIRVQEFGFGFPPRLKAWRRGETLYSINAIPLGGFVRMEGENGDSEAPASFGAKPAWQRALVLSAGAFMNLLCALLLFFLVYTIAPIPLDVPRVSAVQPGSPAASTLQIGDVIQAVNGTAANSQSEVHTLILCSVGKPTTLQVERHGQVLQVQVTPRAHPPAGQGAVGFQGSIDWSRNDALQALGKTIQEPVNFVHAIGTLFRPPLCSPPGSSDVTGPVGIARATGDAANAVHDLGIGPVLYLTALVSLNLAFVNLLPFPALDGGRLLFVVIGVARRRRISAAREGLIHLLGMLILLAFVVLVTGHDITNWLQGR